jgi:hypothetical protein
VRQSLLLLALAVLPGKAAGLGFPVWLLLCRWLALVAAQMLLLWQQQALPLLMLSLLPQRFLPLPLLQLLALAVLGQAAVLVSPVWLLLCRWLALLAAQMLLLWQQQAPPLPMLSLLLQRFLPLPLLPLLLPPLGSVHLLMLLLLLLGSVQYWLQQLDAHHRHWLTQLSGTLVLAAGGDQVPTRRISFPAAALEHTGMPRCSAPLQQTPAAQGILQVAEGLYLTSHLSLLGSTGQHGPRRRQQPGHRQLLPVADGRHRQQKQEFQV